MPSLQSLRTSISALPDEAALLLITLSQQSRRVSSERTIRKHTSIQTKAVNKTVSKTVNQMSPEEAQLLLSLLGESFSE